MSTTEAQREEFDKLHPKNDEVPGILRESFFFLFRKGWEAGLATAVPEVMQVKPAFYGFMNEAESRVDLCFTPSAPRADGVYATPYYARAALAAAAPSPAAEPIAWQFYNTVSCSWQGCSQEEHDRVLRIGLGKARALYAAPGAHPAPAAQPEPIDMVLHCPACGLQHIDSPRLAGDADAPPHPVDGMSHEEAQPFIDALADYEASWTNPPHRSHLCHGCGHIWRPADVPTNGVQAVKTRGKNDSAVEPVRFIAGEDGGPARCYACGDLATRYVPEEATELPGPYCADCGPQPMVTFDDRPQLQQLAEAEQRMRNPAPLQWEVEVPAEPSADSELDKFYRVYDESTKLTGHKPAPFDIWLMARGCMDTSHRTIVSPAREARLSLTDAEVDDLWDRTVVRGKGNIPDFVRAALAWAQEKRTGEAT